MMKRPGDPITASEFNTINDAAAATLNAAGGSGTQVTVSPSGIAIADTEGAYTFREPVILAQAKNTGGVDLAPFDAALIDGHAVDDYQDSRVLNVKRADQSGGPVAVCADGIPQGDVGPVVVSGICLVKVTFHGGHIEFGGTRIRGSILNGYAALFRDSVNLYTADTGPIKLLWWQRTRIGPPSDYLCIARIVSQRPDGIAMVADMGQFGLCRTLEVPHTWFWSWQPGIVHLP